MSATNKDNIIQSLLDEIEESDLRRTEQFMRLATRIADAANLHGYTRNIDLAKAFDVSPSLITKWLSGDHNFTANTLFDIADKLNIELINISDINDELSEKFLNNKEYANFTIDEFAGLVLVNNSEEKTNSIHWS